MFNKVSFVLLSFVFFDPTSAIIALVPTAWLNNNNNNNVQAGGGGFSDALNTAGNIGDVMDFTSDLMDGSLFRDDSNSQVYSDQGTYGNQAIYGDQGTYGTQTVYGQQPTYGVQGNYGTQTVYGQQPTYGGQAAYGAQTAYAVQQPYGSPAVYGGGGYGQSTYNYMSPTTETGTNVQPGEVDPSANMGCEARFVDVHEGKKRYLCNCGELGYSYQYYYCGQMQGQ